MEAGIGISMGGTPLLSLHSLSYCTSRSKASRSANFLNSTALPSITGLPASGLFVGVGVVVCGIVLVVERVK